MHYGGDGRRSKSVWAREPILTPERKVWRAVLEQAYMDAEMTPTDDETGSELFESWKARQYLRADNFQEAEHLKLVCDFADLPADRLILWARQRYPSEPMLENHVECGGSPLLFLPPQTQAPAGVFRQRTESGSQAPALQSVPPCRKPRHLPDSCAVFLTEY